MRPSQSADLAPSVLAGLRAGDVAALEACYGLHGAPVYRLCRAMLGQDSDAEDATQEIFLKVLERAHQFRGRARFSTWLHRMAVNHCLNRIEKEALRRAELLDEGLVDGTPSPLESAQHAEARRRVDALLARVPESQRTVLILREIEGHSYAEISAILEIPVGTVMSRLARARERLAALVPNDRQPSLPSTRSAS